MDLKTMRIPDGLNVMDDGKPFFFDGGGRLGCLLLHGFTGTTSSMKPMGEYLAGKGITVLGPRLPGHGTDVADMGRWSHTDWTQAVETALEELGAMCERVFVAGLSMGGTLTLYLGENRGDAISGIIPICAAASRLSPKVVENGMLKLVPVIKHVLKTFPGPGNDIKDPDVTEVAYEKLSTNALHEFIKLAAGVRDNLSRVTVPIRIFVARDDHVVPPENSRFIYDNVGSSDKELIWLEDSYHVATLDYDKDKIFSGSYEFMREVAGTAGKGALGRA